MMKMITVLLIGALSSFVLSGCIANKNDDIFVASTSQVALIKFVGGFEFDFTEIED